ncbi:MAG: hypothetical protein IPG75_20835 [Gemmatimonadetes bacterium]|nr:hypothetical protein [Gemmatimonadota bacterium]
MQRHQYLSPLNLLFLRVRLLAKFGQWTSLLALPELSDLIQLRRPVAVTEALLVAVYRTALARYEDDSDPVGMIQHFRTSVAPTYQGLLTRSAGLREADALKVMMLVAVAGTPPDVRLCQHLCTLEQLGQSDRAFLRALASTLPATPPVRPSKDLIHDAILAEARGDFEAAFVLALTAPHGVRRTQLLIRLSCELQVLEGKALALESFAELDAEGRKQCLSLRIVRLAFDGLEREAGLPGEPAILPSETAHRPVEPSPRLPNTLEEWAIWAIEQTDAVAVAEVARAGASEWAVEDLLAAPGGTDRVISVLNTHSSSLAIQYAIPHVVALFTRDHDWPRPECRGVYRALLLSLWADTRGGRNDLRVAAELAEALFNLGMDAPEYAEVVGMLRDIMGTSGSLDAIARGLEVVEMMSLAPSPNDHMRGMLLVDVDKLIRKHARHVDPAHRRLFAMLADELGQRDLPESVWGEEKDAVEGAAPESVLAGLNGLSVAIYSLSERAAQNLKNLLFEEAPEAKVQLLHDRDCSSRLRQIAAQGGRWHAEFPAVISARLTPTPNGARGIRVFADLRMP